MTALAGVTIVYMVLYKAGQVIQTGFLWDKLPLHACNLAAVLALPAALAGNRRWGQPLRGFCFYGGVIFSLAAMAMPERGYDVMPLLSINALGFYGFHGLVLAQSFCFATWGLHRPAWRDLYRSPLILAAMALPVHGINLLLRATVYPQANFFYTCGLAGNPVMEWLYGLIPVPFLFELPLTLLMALLCGVMLLLSRGMEGLCAFWARLRPARRPSR